MEMKRFFNKTMVVSLLLGYAFVLAGCFNPLTSSDGQGDTAKGQLTVTVKGDGVGGARTLLPASMSYTLSFTGPAGEPHSPVMLSNGETSTVITDLAPGYWTINAIGYDGMGFAAANGSAGVTVTEEPTTVSIPLRALLGGGNGSFSYSVNFPSDRGISEASLGISPLNGNEESYKYVNLLEPNKKAGSFSLPPGYYLMTIQLRNAYQTAGRTEIVHIYSNMETRTPHYEFTADDFTDTITLGGTINATINGSKPQGVYIYAWETTTGNQVGYTYLYSGDFSAAGRATWSIPILPFAQATNVTFSVEVYDGNNWFYKDNIENTTVGNMDILTILLTVPISTITLAGTINVTVNSRVPQEVYIYARETTTGNQVGYTYLDSEDFSAAGQATWSIPIEPFAQATNVTFDVVGYDDGYQLFYRENVISESVFNQSKDNILLDIGNIISTGNVTVEIGNETITLNGVREEISKSSYEQLEIWVSGDYESYHWYVDGEERYRSWDYYIYIYSEDMPVGLHTVAVTVVKDGIPYSVEASFNVTK
jgi:hypothetical protein